MEIKRGTTPVLTVRFKGLDEGAAVERAEFIFKQACSESAPELVRKSWPGEAARTEEGDFRVPFSEAETRRFEEGKYMYMDTRIHLTGGGIASAPVAELMVRQTLFEREAGM